MWEFFAQLFDYLRADGTHWAKVEADLQTILSNQEKIKELLMTVEEAVAAHATAVNAFSDQIAASLEGVRADIVALRSQLANASTPAKVDEILSPALTKLGAQVAALKALDEENVPSIPGTEPPPEEPPL